MKKINRALALVLALVMTLSLSISVSAGYEVTADSKELSAVAADLSGKTVIMHSNDVHGQIDGYAYIAALKTELAGRGAEVILADAGDFSQGDPYVSLSKGATAVEMMNAAGYTVVTLGNHEIDYGYAQMVENLSKAEFKVVCANITENGKASFDPTFVYETKSGVKIGFFGLETPEAKTKSNPALTVGMDVLGNTNGKTDLYDCAKAQVAALKEAGADLVIALTHLGVDDESAPDGHRSADLFANVTGIDLIIDGHSHTVMTAGEESAAIQSTGTKFANIGAVVIDDASKKIEDRFLIPTEGLAKDETVAAAAQKIMDEVDAELGAVFAKSEVELNGAKAPNGNRDSQTNNGRLITDAMSWVILKDAGSVTVPAENVVSIQNGGGIRAAIKVGDVTKKDINTVLPFGNTVTVVYVTGAELLEVLEASTFCTPTAVGGYPQTNGIEWTIDLAKAYDANDESYPGSTYYGPKTIQRVSIQSVNGKAFDEAATYALITNDFCAAGGDTYYALTKASGQFDTGIPLDEAIMQYVEQELGGVIGSKYATARGDVTVLTDPLAAFTDVDAALWYAPALRYAIENKIMNGTGGGKFSPNGAVTRGTVMTMLARMDGVDTTPAEGENWYDKGVAWAMEKGVSDGTNPTADITREQFATMLYRYEKEIKGGGFVGAWMFLLENPDAADVSSWADEAMHWMVMNKVVNGVDAAGTLAPQDGATRAAVAQMLLNYSNVAK